MKTPARKPRLMTILLVDDNAERRSARAIVLLTHGYGVQSTADFADALRICAADAPDLLLIGTSDRVGACPSLAAMSKSHPWQRVGFLLNDGERLCAVRFNGELLLPHEGADDYVSRVAMLLEPRESVA